MGSRYYRQSFTKLTNSRCDKPRLLPIVIGFRAWPIRIVLAPRSGSVGKSRARCVSSGCTEESSAVHLEVLKGTNPVITLYSRTLSFSTNPLPQTLFYLSSFFFFFFSKAHFISLLRMRARGSFSTPPHPHPPPPSSPLSPPRLVLM